ncbi:unnamed protein product [Amoebophrya sp. A25]|nr:unnamed protein product [Amoebophrya sp. A25]|eukprot:GSA25T00001195001.1
MELPSAADLRLHRPLAIDIYRKLKTFVETECAIAEVAIASEFAALPAEFPRTQERVVGAVEDSFSTSSTLSTKPASRWTFLSPTMQRLRQRGKELGLWNLWSPTEGPRLTNLEYAHCAELLGRYMCASEACNCAAPDTGNMEVLAMYGSEAQKKRWLAPLLSGDIRSVFFMTEPQRACSDARNVQLKICREGDYYVLNGRKWWSSGVCDLSRCKVGILMGQIEDESYDGSSGQMTEREMTSSEQKTSAGRPKKKQTMILVPMNTNGVHVVRPLTVFGYDDAPHGHGEVEFRDARVRIADALLLGEGRGFEIAQGRLGPGRIHHCMRCIGMAERAYALMLDRGLSRQAFGRRLAELNVATIAQLRIQIEAARLLVLQAAARIDAEGAKSAFKEIAMIKVLVPRMTCDAVDAAIQLHGGAGVSADTPLARMYAIARTMRIVDGPDEVHLMSIGRMEIKRHALSSSLASSSKL